MRVSTAFKRLMDLPGVTVTDVVFEAARVVVTVKLRSGKLCCPECGYATRSRYDARPVASTWRHLDLGCWRLEVRAVLRRLRCPTHGVRTQGVPFARAGSRFTGDFEDLVGWLATTMDTTALCRLVRIDWDTVGRIIERVMASGLDPKRLDRLFVAGVDEVSWRKGHSYVTLASNHETGKFVWGKEGKGKDTDTLDCFFDELGDERSAAITAMSMDMGPAYEKSAKQERHAVNAVICYDPFHVVQVVTTALDKVRRSVWQDLRKLPDQEGAKRFKGARWALLKNPDDLTDDQAATLRKLKRRGGDLWRGLRAEGGPAGHLRRRPYRRRSGRASRPVLLQGTTLRPEVLRHRGQDHPQATCGHPGRDPTRREQCPPRGTEPPSPPHRQPGLRLPLRQRRARAHHAHARTHRTRPPARTAPGLRSLNRPTSMPGGPEIAAQLVVLGPVSA